MFLDMRSTYPEELWIELAQQSAREIGNLLLQIEKVFLIDENSSWPPVTGGVSRAAPMILSLNRNTRWVQGY